MIEGLEINAPYNEELVEFTTNICINLTNSICGDKHYTRTEELRKELITERIKEIEDIIKYSCTIRGITINKIEHSN